MKKRVVGMLIVGCMILGSIGMTNRVSASEVPSVRPTGLIEIEVVDAGEIEESDVYVIEDDTLVGSSMYATEWDSYSANYVYNMLNDDERALWDGLDASCRQVLLGTDNLEEQYIPFVYYDNMSRNQAISVVSMFRYTNPQYYFLNTRIATGSMGDACFTACGVYTAFMDGGTRQTATQNVKNQADAWKNAVSGYSSDEQKVKALHDLIVEKVEYNNDIYSASFDENTAYSQSAYSVFCTDKTVCAGYAQAFEMMCNSIGVDCIAVTSDDHEWNKVRLNDSWFNVDCTWADQSSRIDYSYFERSDACYDSDSAYYASSHAEEGFWIPYLPLCTLDSGATSTNPGSLPSIAQTTAQPQISVENAGGYYRISITSDTSNATIYYTVNGDTPSVSSTRSYYYDAPFAVAGDCTVKAIAVKDAHRDSAIVSRNVAESVGEPDGGTTPDEGTAPDEGTTPDNGNEAKAAPFVRLLYQYVLDREAAQSEVDYWINELSNGRTGAEVAFGFIFSQEFQNKNYNDGDYVEHLYLSLMGRPSDEGGKADWVTHLENGVSRQYVFRQFTDSVEFGNLCQQYEIQRGTITLTEARDQNYNVTRFVARNYTEFLGRSYDVDGLNDWCGRINSGYGMDQVALGFVFSPECINMNLSNDEYVKMLYRGIFGRTYDEAGLADWVNQLNQGTARETVFWGFANSQEFANMVASYGL